jgi:hypothetical protein
MVVNVYFYHSNSIVPIPVLIFLWYCGYDVRSCVVMVLSHCTFVRATSLFTPYLRVG